MDPLDRPLAAILVRARIALGAAALIPGVAPAEPLDRPPAEPQPPAEISAADQAAALRQWASDAHAAGDLVGYRDYLLELLARSSSPATRAELDRLAASYGEVRITGRPEPRARLLSLDGATSASGEAQACLARASEALARTGEYAGLLPIGDLRLGSFELVVAPGANPPIQLPDPSDAAREDEQDVAPTCGPCCHDARGRACRSERRGER